MRVAVEEEYSADGQPANDPPVDEDSNSNDGGGAADSNPDSGDPTVNGGPPDVPDDSGDGGETVVSELSCGCEITAKDTDEMQDGQTYRCTSHGTRFTYNE